VKAQEYVTKAATKEKKKEAQQNQWPLRKDLTAKLSHKEDRLVA